MMRPGLLLLLFSGLLIIPGCKQNSSTATSRIITVSILPQKFLVEQICGKKYQVGILLPPGANHETYEPSPKDLVSLAGARLYFSIGYLDFEQNWLPRILSTQPEMKLVNTSAGIDLIKGHHDHNASGIQGIDPHTWLSPSCVRIQAGTITKALVGSYPSDSVYFHQNLKMFLQLVDSVDKQIRIILSTSQTRSFLIFHPALAYFARDYSLEQISIEQEGKEPSAAGIRQLIDLAKAKNIKTIFISREFDVRNAEAIASEINAKLVVIDPMAENWPDNMIKLAELIAGKQ